MQGEPLYSKNISQSLRQAHSLLLDNQTIQAIEKYQQLIEIDEPYIEHQILGLGNRAEIKIRQEKDLLWFRRVKQEKEQQITAYDGLSVAFSTIQQFEQADQYYCQMLQRYPDNVSLILGVANLYFNLGQHQKSEMMYGKIQSHSLNFKIAIKQLALLSFYNNKHEQLKKYLQFLEEEIEGDYLLELLYAFSRSSLEQQIQALVQLCKSYPNYVRPHYFLGVLFLQKGEQAKASQEFMQCKKINPKYVMPIIVKAKYKASKGQLKQAIAELQQSRKKWVFQDGYLINLMLGFYYLRNQSFSQSRKNLKVFESELSTKGLELLQSSFIYLLKLKQKMEHISQSIQNGTLEKYLKWKEIKRFEYIVESICSEKQSSVNAQVNILRKQDFILLSFVEDTFFTTFSFNHSLLKSLALLNLDQNRFFQLFTISTSQCIKQNIKIFQTIGGVQQHILEILNSFEYFVPDEGVEEGQQMMEANKKIHTIKYTDKEYYLFQGQYFSNYEHLFTSLKKIKKTMKNAQTQIDDLIGSILHEFQPEDAEVLYKIDPLNLEICIDQLIIENLPQLNLKVKSFYSRIDEQLSFNKDYSLLTLFKVVNQEIKNIIDKALRERRERKQPLRLSVDDWIQAIFFFSNQVTIVRVIDALEDYCRSKKYEITKVQGSLLKSDRIPGISIKIKIHNACFKMTFYHQKQKVQILFKKNLEKVNSFRLGCSILGLLEINKVRRQPLSEVLRDAISCQRKGSPFFERTNDIAVCLNRFLAQYAENPSNLQKSNYSKDLQRESQKFKTQILRLENRNKSFLTDLNSTSRAHKQSLDESDFKSESTIIKRLNIPSEIERKGKHRTITQENESVDSELFDQKFDEADVEDNSSSKDHKKTICKSIQIFIEGLKIHQEDDGHSKETEGETQVNLLNEKIFDMSVTIKNLENQKKRVLEDLSKHKDLSSDLEGKLYQQSLKHCREIQELKAGNEQLQMAMRGLEKKEKEFCAVSAELADLNETVRELLFKEKSLQSRIKDYETNEGFLKEELEKLQLKPTSREKFDSELTVNRSASLILEELQDLKQTLAERSDREILLEKIGSIELQLREMKSMVESHNLIVNSVKQIQTHIVQREREDTLLFEHIRQTREEFKKRPTVAEVAVQTEESHSEEDEESEEDAEDGRQCGGCEQLKERNWQLNKKIYYHSLIFIVLLFEAVTFTFSTRIFK